LATNTVELNSWTFGGIAVAAQQTAYYREFFVHSLWKGTIQESVSATLGDYAVTAELDLLAERNRPGGPRPELVRLRGARMVPIYETSRRLKLSASLAKSL